MAYLSNEPNLYSKLGPELAQKLVSFNIRHVEQLAALIANPYGLVAFEELAGSKLIAAVKPIAEKYIWQNYAVKLAAYGGQVSGTNSSGETPAQNYAKKLGYAFPSEFRFMQPIIELHSHNGQGAEASTPPEGSSPTLPDQSLIFGVDAPPEPKDQGHRGTCAAFTIINLIEFDLNRQNIEFEPLSVQYLFMQAKRLDSDAFADGTTFQRVLEALETHGICPERFLPYRPLPDHGQFLHLKQHEHSLRKLDSCAGYCANSSYTVLTNGRCSNVPYLKEMLSRGNAVGLGVHTFDYSWIGNGTTMRTGEVILPILIQEKEEWLMTDNPTGAHAITLVGYVDETGENARPGGGYFIFKNSWGTSWAHANTKVGAGYGILPYEYVQRYSIAAAMLSGTVINKDALQ